MKLPQVIIDGLSRAQIDRWRHYYEKVTDRDQRVEEGLWRRTQDSRNSFESGWTSRHDARRRILHYRYTYDRHATGGQGQIVLRNLYLFHSVSYPTDEAVSAWDSVRSGLTAGGWTQESRGARLELRRGDLRAEIKLYTRHPEDDASGRVLPSGYQTIDVAIRTAGCEVSSVQRRLPWEVLQGGMRVKDQRGCPANDDELRTILDYLPFHVELGCGPSIEAGIPPLHYLHTVYQVTDRHTGKFVLHPTTDSFMSEFLTFPEEMIPKITRLFSCCFLSEPTAAHRILRRMHDAGYMIGPVITNNVDGLAHRVGLPEVYVRRYDEQVPQVPFLPEAKSLLVIGSHADRRRVQARARSRGLKVFFVDPEGFWEDGSFVPYPLEGARDEDVLCGRIASDAMSHLAKHLGIET